MQSKRQVLVRRLLDWYDRHHRPLPWRETSDPYRIWVSEIMLQQTQVETVLPYYERFLERFPTVEALAAAKPDEVLRVWEGLGYYARARNLHAAARRLVERSGGRVPETREALLALPGIGAYTAGAILSIAFGRRAASIDGNVRRVWSRIFASADGRTAPADLEDLAATIVPREAPGRFNQAVMDLGATVCTPRNPRCDGCPLRDLCPARAGGLQHVLPAVKKKAPVPERDGTAGVVTDAAGRLLIVQRPAEGLLGSLWKFPGGFSRPGEPPEATLERTVREELGIRIRVGDRIGAVKQVYTHFRLTLHVFTGRIGRGRPRALACQDWAWAPLDTLADRPFSGVDRKVMAVLAARR
ncbi:MAG: A/G-specific adenine glycosylase [Syntrophales bacterium]|jgi:A/G-specific adenine glycosylase|nr:A/G-specific adenine glycosylase [Syntrophales bacterium]MDD4338836.1 A/G-specific adenine glycosylase [Syntrophales bacterium]HOG06707.1 A/G-specific adenine glycosylase [Syntrophales bacterium]HOS77255.1 A/G-specific adenine glycosylase [Syntrophales bacterium]HPB71025.1 A/G-specific adenine glycosylase [Syntrophales bacterium]